MKCGKVIAIKRCDDKRIALHDDLIRRMAEDQNRRMVQAVKVVMVAAFLLVLYALGFASQVYGR